MPLTLAAVGQKIAAAFVNPIVAVVNRQGLTAVIPTSVSGAGAALSARGTVTLSAATADITINGCFTSEFAHVVAVVDMTTSVSGNPNLQLTASGTPSTAGYDTSRVGTASTSTALNSQDLNAANWPLTVSTSNGLIRITGEVHILRAAVAGENTQGWSTVGATPNPGAAATTMSIGSRLLMHRTVGAFDGLKWLAGGGTWSGTIRFYGYNDN